MNIDLASVWLFPVIVLVTLYVNNKKDETIATDDWLFGVILLSQAYLTSTFFLSWIPDGRFFPGDRFVIWTLNMLYLAPVCAVSVLWHAYVYTKLNGGKRLAEHPYMLLGISVPQIICLSITITSPWTGLVFNIDASNRYVRGPLYNLPYFIIGFYALMTMIYALWRARGLSIKSDKKLAWLLTGLTPLPIVGMILQGMFYGLWIGWPLSALASVVLSVSIQNRRITADSLTGLNNRRELERYLSGRLKQGDGAKPWCLIFADVDDFKRINDVFGHLVGDEALRLAANVLRVAFRESGAFLSRCGGDEFAIAADCANAAEAQALVDRLCDAVQKVGDGMAYTFSLSAGFALAAPRMDAERLIALADKAMYDDKRRKKLRQGEKEELL